MARCSPVFGKLLFFVLPILYWCQPELLRAQFPVFQVATQGCPMAHCDSALSNVDPLLPPTSASPILLAHDTLPVGSNAGLGCASNGSVVVCSYTGGSRDNVVAYSNTGARLWTSGQSLDQYAWMSAPMVAPDGGAIAAAHNQIARFDSTGALLWSTGNPSGTPISPVLTASGTVVVANLNGPVSALDSVTGLLLGSLFVRQSPNSPTFFDTANTPCVNGNRVYVSMKQKNDPLNTGWLVAIDVDATNPVSPLTVAWQFTFGGPSGASPVRIGNVIYFDGASVTPGGKKAPQLFAVRDDGTTGTLLWDIPMLTPVAASPAVDPRGGLWYFSILLPWLSHIDAQTGRTIETINVSRLVGDANSNIPASALSITGLPAAPVLILGTGSINGLSSYVIAINLATRTLAWKFNLRPSLITDYASGQFPIVITPTGKPAIAFTTHREGAYFVADP